MGEKKLSDGNESVMSVNFEENAEVNKSWHLYLKPDLAHHYDVLLMVESILLRWPLCSQADEEGDCKALYVPVYLCKHTSSSSRNSFLSAFPRMVARRGKPEMMISDNVTNFTSAERELRDPVSSLDQTLIKEQVAQDGIQWRFNPPVGSHYGGIFEVPIKSAKKTLRAILGKSRTTNKPRWSV